MNNNNSKEYKEINIGEFEIDISGKTCKVNIRRNKEGTLEIEPFLDGTDIFAKGGYLEDGHCIEGYNFEVNITKFIK